MFRLKDVKAIIYMAIYMYHAVGKQLIIKVKELIKGQNSQWY